MSKQVDYFFAPLSPWAYLGHARFVDMVRRHDARVEIKPMDIGKVFSVSGGLPLAKRAPQRQAYRLTELKRWSEHLGVPLDLSPAFFPASVDLASKLILAVRIAHGVDAALDLTGDIMRAMWAERRNIADAATLQELALAAGHDGESLVKVAETAPMQAAYDRCTDEAIARDVFGSPWYVVDGEHFWGQDRLDFVERALAR